MRLHTFNICLIFCWLFSGIYSAFIFALCSSVHFLMNPPLGCVRFERKEYMRLLNVAVKLSLSWVSDTSRFQGCLRGEV